MVTHSLPSPPRQSKSRLTGLLERVLSLTLRCTRNLFLANRLLSDYSEKNVIPARLGTRERGREGATGETLFSF